MTINLGVIRIRFQRDYVFIGEDSPRAIQWTCAIGVACPSLSHFPLAWHVWVADKLYGEKITISSHHWKFGRSETHGEDNAAASS